MNKTLGGLVVGVVLIAGTAPAFAAHQDILGRTVPDSTAEGWGDDSGARSVGLAAADAAGTTFLTQETVSQMGRKLERGLVNASTGWLELPKAVYVLNEDWGLMFATTVGGLDGLEKAAVRTLAGVYEAATFPVPIPAEYAPVVLPTSAFTWEGLYLRSPR